MSNQVLIISYSELHRDPRVLRQIRLCFSKYSVIAMGYTPPEVEGTIFYKLTRPKRSASLIRKLRSLLCYMARDYIRLLWVEERKRDYLQLNKHKIDLVILNDIESIPMVWHLVQRDRPRVIFDLHEYYLDYQQKQSFLQTVIRDKTSSLIRLSQKFVDHYYTVSPGLIELYRKIGIEADLLPNSAAYCDLCPTEVNAENIRLVHHGVAAPGRKIELQIEMMQYLDSHFEMHFYLVRTHGLQAYYDQLVHQAGSLSTRIYFHEPVKTELIATEINKYDIGVFILPPTSLNYTYALPNKLFEFIQARLAIAIGPSRDMTSIVEEHNLGVVSEGFDSRQMAFVIKALDAADILKFKRNSAIVAKQLSADVQYEVLDRRISALLVEKRKETKVGT